MEPDLKEIDLCIIDPVSPEFNRGSFCYLPYLLYSFYKSVGVAVVRLRENFCAADIDKLPKAKHYAIALWSHPQLEHVTTLLRFLPPGDASVFGYVPLIKTWKFPLYPITDDMIKKGIETYPLYQHEFSHILLSDCDMHLKEYEGQVWPLFTSYGCPRMCSFCPSSVNQPRRIQADLDEVKINLSWMGSQRRTCIHFTDEDFFHCPDRALKICEHLIQSPYKWNLIALAERHTLSSFISRNGCKVLHDAGFKLLEVGLESADASLSKGMGKGGLDACVRLAETCDIPILWLALTFFPGECIRSLRETGIFLSKYGMKPEQLYSRIATNGTEGGLGQFFQPYEGTPGFTELKHLGMWLTDRPLRLLPSYLPNSFLDDMVHHIRPVDAEEQKWFDMYRVPPPPPTINTPQYVSSLVMHEKYNTIQDGAVSVAIAARLGVIR